ncbi:MAG: DNA repair protein RecN [Muribaculaceae bacterium]|nr:DNA repair protein RecN [Muribaculaceae bacterium]
MIKSLHISNYALISDLDIEFESGFNIITGETGAGKSIILGALSMLLGERADTKVVRDMTRKLVVEAVFDISKSDKVVELLKSNSLDSADTECILRREIAPGGRSRAFVNDTPVTLPVLREIAQYLVDIHSQHRNLLLSTAEYQLDIIDSLAGVKDILEDYHKALNAYKIALKQYTETRDLVRRNRDDADFLQYQYNQLVDLNLQPGEHSALEQEREILSNVNEIKSSLSAVLEPMTNGSSNVLSLMHRASEALEELLVTIDSDGNGEIASLAERLNSARIEISDIVDTLADYDTSIVDDPARLEEVEQRLSMLYSLELKHHVEDSDGLIAIRDRLATQIEALDDSESVLAKLETAAKRAKKNAIVLATELSERRSAAAKDFAEQLRQTAAPLGMSNLRCEISLTRGKLTTTGFDQIQFLFAFNKNQALMPVGETASGGEISRLMLAIKAIVARRMQLPSIIFDEIDTGISGNIASRMAEMMTDISSNIQVITITHLPGVAAAGSAHYKVYKEDDAQTTTTRISRLSQEERAKELALMISGNSTDESALATARTLLNKNRDNGQ